MKQRGIIDFLKQVHKKLKANTVLKYKCFFCKTICKEYSLYVVYTYIAALYNRFWKACNYI